MRTAAVSGRRRQTPFPPSQDVGAPNTKSYSAQGVVEQIAPDRRTLTIHHETIPGYMMEMTMEFTVKIPTSSTAFHPPTKSLSRWSWVKMTIGSKIFVVWDTTSGT